MTGQDQARHIEGVFSEKYTFFNRVPISIQQAAYPHAQISKLKYNMGIFAQDTWTLDRLTLNLGVRFDLLNGYNPAQTRPAGLYTLRSPSLSKPTCRTGKTSPRVWAPPTTSLATAGRRSNSNGAGT